MNLNFEFEHTTSTMVRDNDIDKTGESKIYKDINNDKHAYKMTGRFSITEDVKWHQLGPKL